MEALETLRHVAPFLVIAVAAAQIGRSLSRLELPMISGFLITGIFAGPYVLGMVAEPDLARLGFVNELALAFIAFAAGAELELEEVRGTLRSISLIIVAQTVTVVVIGTVAFAVLADYIPFMANLSTAEVLAVGLLGSTIMVARSPSTALAIIRELRARGPFTQKVLGTTVLTDAVVIVVFSAGVSVAAVLVEGANLDIRTLGFIGTEIALDTALGVVVAGLLWAILRLPAPRLGRGVLVLAAGYGVFFVSGLLRHVPLAGLPIHVFSEPLLVSMVAGFALSNFTRFRNEFQRVVADLGPAVFVLFFTLVGADLEVPVLLAAWAVAVALLVVRIVGIFAGSFIGGVVAGDPLRQNALLGFTFITQAGVSIGLAKEIGVEFPPWGNELATLLIAIIVANQLIGPPFFKWAVRKVGEAHVPGTGREDGHRDAVIFGLERQSFALARQLRSHDWNVRVIALNGQDLDRVAEADVEIETIPGLTVEALKAAKVDKAEAVVAILGDDDSLRLCGLLQEQFDVANVIVLLRDRAKAEAFLAYEVTIVEPSTAIVELLEHMVRSPSGAKLLLGMDGQQDVLDVLLENPRLDGRTLRSLNLPLDALILSVRRDDSVLISHGYTRLRIGDTVTVVGSPQALEDVAMRFGA